MPSISAIIFDLDDTLWDLGPVIVRAERGLYDWFGEYYPKVCQHYSADDVLAVRQRIADEHPHLIHDLGYLRRKALGEIAATAGYGDDMVQSAFDHFQSIRNDVTVHGDVLPVLDNLRCDYSLYVLTNGNADLSVIGIDGYFRDIFTARELGCAKPEPAVFTRVAEATGLPTSQLMHVGNDPEHDVVPAREAGMFSVWINRAGHDWPGDLPAPDLTITDLSPLPEFVRRG